MDFYLQIQGLGGMQYCSDVSVPNILCVVIASGWPPIDTFYFSFFHRKYNAYAEGSSGLWCDKRLTQYTVTRMNSKKNRTD